MDVLSSKVGMSIVFSESGTDLKVYVGYGNLDEGVYGVAQFWNTTFLGQVTEVEPWDGSDFDSTRVRLKKKEFQKDMSTFGRRV